ncbi:hypothetical protein BOTBODRAFT_513935 [Botryobasidium botryosum FD-172 SS1]|uniref:F-box domain-containing protein n=1 Tax=Botryobasidium botryosum (strain FD-172 SS1) TaxID=930990 RepID=A0A067MRZ6_BOTB1|nr:hypothetical protein BOTBODRAFT_513935 [Botryobasidium botryosum FD-172 SS1]
MDAARTSGPPSTPRRPGSWSVPLELVIEMIGILGTMGSSHPIAYQRDQQIITAFLQLALVSRSFHTLVVPVLYRSVALRTPEDIARFALTLSADSAIASKATHVRSLSLTGLGDTITPESIGNISSILFAVAPSLQHLFANFPLVQLTHCAPDLQPVRSALAALSQLVEFVSVKDDFLRQNGPCSLGWPRWENIRRLALSTPRISRQFLRGISSFPRLEILTLVAPYPDSPALEPAMTIPPNLRRVLIPIHPSTSDALCTAWGGLFTALAARRGTPVEVAFPPVWVTMSQTMFVQRWFQIKSDNGELWEVDGVELADSDLFSDWGTDSEGSIAEQH